MKSRLFYVLLTGTLIIFFVITYIVLGRFGANYDAGLASIIQKSSDAPAPRKLRTVRKVIVMSENESGCMEITPDGVVRTYETCGGTLIDANRLSNPKNILRLIETASSIDLEKYRVKPKGPSLTLIIQTDSGSETIYIPTDDGGNDVTIIIDQITGDLPQPTATPGPYIEVPTPTMGGVSNSPTPSPLISNTPGPSPTPTPEGQIQPDNPFVCGFGGSSTQKPYNVSNFICSTQPSPAPTP